MDWLLLGIGVALMVLGIGFIGVLTATITSAFLDTGQEARDVQERLTRIEQKLDALVRKRDQPL